MTGVACAWTALAQNALVPPGGPPPLAPVPAEEGGSAKLPARPDSALLDDGNIFSAEERIQLESDLEDFRARTGLRLYVATLHYVHGESLDAWSRQLLQEWTQHAPGLLVVYERGSRGLSFQGTRGTMRREEEMRQLFRIGDAAGKSLPKDSTAAQRLRALLLAMTVAGETWQQTGQLPSRDDAGPPPAPEAQTPGAPVDFVRDDANLIPDDEEAALKLSLIQFHSRWNFDVFVVSATWLTEGSTGEWAAALAQRWLAGRRGVVIACNRGSSAAGAEEKPLALHATESAELLLGAAVWQKLTTAAPEILRAEEPQSKATGLTRVARFTMETIEARAAEAGKAAGRGSLPGQSTVILGLAGALVVGSGVLFVFHRLQERLEGRSSEQFRFPDVPVHARLGAEQGGGVVAGGSFRAPPP